MKNNTIYRRKLPHIHPPQSIFSLTYRLAGSIPTSSIRRIQYNHLEKNSSSEVYFKEYECELEKNNTGPFWLNDPRVAKIILDSLLFNDQKQYDLSCATLMGNHVHVVLKTLGNSPPLEKILQNHKKFTARFANQVLERSGTFWAQETFDTLIRNLSHYWNAVNYCVQNPVSAGFVKNWQDWEWTYIKPSLKAYVK